MCVSGNFQGMKLAYVFIFVFDFEKWYFLRRKNLQVMWSTEVIFFM